MREGAGGGARYPPREHGAGAAQGVQGRGEPTEGIMQGTGGQMGSEGWRRGVKRQRVHRNCPPGWAFRAGWTEAWAYCSPAPFKAAGVSQGPGCSDTSSPPPGSRAGLPQLPHTLTHTRKLTHSLALAHPFSHSHTPFHTLATHSLILSHTHTHEQYRPHSHSHNTCTLSLSLSHTLSRTPPPSSSPRTKGHLTLCLLMCRVQPESVFYFPSDFLE